MNRNLLWTVITCSTVSLFSCTTIEPANVSIEPLDFKTEVEQTRTEMDVAETQPAPVEVPVSLTEELLSLTDIPETSQYLDIEATNRPAKQFFAELGASQGMNLLVDPAVTESITLSLRHVTFKQIISALQDSYGFDFKKTSYGYRVSPSQVSTQIYRLNYLNVQREGVSSTAIGSDESNSSTTLTTSFSASSSDSGSGTGFWSGIENSINGFIDYDQGDRKAIVVNPQTGLLVVSATTQEHAEIAQFLLDAQLILQKQVIIEAKIVEVVLDQEYNSGINWSFLNDNLSGGLSGDSLDGIDGVGGVFNLSLSVDDFTSVLELLDYQGDAQVLSSPRVSTVNNQKAVIKVGADEYFATVTSIETDSDDDDDDTTITPTIEMEQFFSGIALDVTPQIADDDYVTLHVRPSVTEVTSQTKTLEFDGEDYSLPVAYSNTRESDSIIRAKSGQIVVIGGLLQQSKDISSAGIPWLQNVPGLRFFFAQDRQAQEKSELVILLKPTVFDENTSTTDIDNILKRFE
ncbi:type II secretion system protein GspD [Reinekea marinisedimentorum]|uniref:MSHA biogenesis protein MshL n=1 Tax=Reinekea marinisedimentorum TaxID=230495 RepID=A0A4R3IBZ8_9GAMM|nr:pilus (MSHA type) biogenesis protein MshL [Reinekea marinisedimentorum]TCS43183.1 MSHA biogenesis protein MshL [Reinekea marinisedimentorum]